MTTWQRQYWYPDVGGMLFVLWFCLLARYANAAIPSELKEEAQSRCVIVEVFVDQSRLLDQQLESRIREFARERGGILIAVRKLQDGVASKNRLEQITGHFQIEANDKPLLYCLNQAICNRSNTEDYQQALEKALQIEVFVRDNCSRCDALKRTLPGYLTNYPALRAVYRDIERDTTAVQQLNQLVTRHKKAASSVPVVNFCDQLGIGFINEQTSRKQLDDVLRKWTKECPPTSKDEPSSNPREDNKSKIPSEPCIIETESDCYSCREIPALSQNVLKGVGFSVCSFVDSTWLLSFAKTFHRPVFAGTYETLNCRNFGRFFTATRFNSIMQISARALSISGVMKATLLPAYMKNTGSLLISEHASQSQRPIADDELEIDDDLMLPIEDPSMDDAGESELGTDPIADDRFVIDLPWFGGLNAKQLGMPLFTIAVGLVDGFNPCAMWVLLFLLSILVNLQDRMRIVLIAGIFIIVSGLAYYAFMAAWLNVFLFVGLLRPIQIGLGLLALVVGGIHIKDFFAFKQGVSLSIPESAKPGIYQRARAIVTAQNLWGALIGVTVLAVLVNMVELLCTAGLPALYTGVLTLQGLPSWQNYAYLALYIAAYMFDDTLMVVLVVWTMKKTKMQESQGRWLKLISGVAIVVIGLIMLFKPSWLY